MPLLMPSTFAPMENGDYLYLGQDKNENHHEIARHSPHDADAYDAYAHMMEQAVHAIRPLMDSFLPDITSKDPEERARLALMGSYIADLPPNVLHDLIRLLTGSAADILEDYFESNIMQGLHASSGIIGTKVGPRFRAREWSCSITPSASMMAPTAPGRSTKEATAVSPRCWRGPLSRLAPRYASNRQSHVITKNGRAIGVMLEDGTELEAKTVVSAVDPRRTFMELVDPRELPTDLVDNIRRFKFQGTSAKVNFALDANPTYPALPGRSDQYRGFINMGPSLDYLERAFDDAKYGWYSQKPYIDGCIQSNVDPDMAPPGKAVMSCFIQYAPYDLKESDLGQRERIDLGTRCRPPWNRSSPDSAIWFCIERWSPHSTSSARLDSPKATSSPVSFWLPRCFSSVPHLAGTSTGPRSRATTSVAPVPILVVA